MEIQLEKYLFITFFMYYIYVLHTKFSTFMYLKINVIINLKSQCSFTVG